MTTEITLNGKVYVEKTEADYSKFSIMRCRDAGVHFGILGDDNGRGFTHVTNCRRLWKWVSKATLSELSQEGPVSIPENKYGMPINLLLRTKDICEIIPCTQSAAQKINSVPIWIAKQ